MKPYTLDDAETDLAAALADGDPDRINTAAAAVDRLDPALHPTAPPSLHAVALWYAQHGLPVFPLQPGAKIPLKGSRGCHDATTDTDQVNTWWTNTPDANIGLATGYLVDVVDIDGLVGHQSRLAAWDMFTNLDVVGKVTTPRPGGMHILVPASGHGNKAGILPGVDYRGAGGYVVAPPSRLDDRRSQTAGTYRFLMPLDVERCKKAGAA